MAAPPDDAALAARLGAARAAWDAVVAHLDACPGVRREWKHYGATHGWQLKAVRGGRAVLYLIPREGCFTAALALPEDALAAVRASALPADLIRSIEGAKVHAEGRPAQVEVTGAAEIAVVEELLAIKLGDARTMAAGYFVMLMSRTRP